MSRIPSPSRVMRPLALTALATALAVTFALPQTARASGFQLHENSAQAMGRAYAGLSVAGGDCSVVMNNPAAMSILTGGCFQADVSAINFRARFHGSAIDAMGRPISGGNGGDAGVTVPIPAFSWAMPLGQKWHVGVGVNVPFGLQTQYDSDWVGRYNAIKSKLEALDATVSVSWAATENFSLGASLIAQRTNAELTSAINYNMVTVGLVQQAVAAGAIPAGAEQAIIDQFTAVVPPGSDGLARINGHDWGMGWQVGALWQMTPADRVALNYRSKIKHTIHGTANFTMPANVEGLLANPVVASLLSGLGGVPFQHTGGTAGISTPAVVNLGYWHRASRFGIGAELSWTKWDVLKDLRVQYANPAQPDTVETFNWRNTWYAAVGGDWYVNDRLTLRGGLALDTTPTHVSTRDARVPDGTRKIVSMGAGYRFSDRLRLDASYEHIFIDTPHLDGSLSSTGDALTGSYSGSANLLALSVQYAF